MKKSERFNADFPTDPEQAKAFRDSFESDLLKFREQVKDFNNRLLSEARFQAKEQEGKLKVATAVGYVLFAGGWISVWPVNSQAQEVPPVEKGDSQPVGFVLRMRSSMSTAFEYPPLSGTCSTQQRSPSPRSPPASISPDQPSTAPSSSLPPEPAMRPGGRSSP